MNRPERLEFNRRNIAEFRSSGGRIASFGDATMLLLTTTGASSGLPRTSPLAYLADEHDPNRVYVFASAAGQDQNPAWFDNLVAKPDDLVVEIGTDRVAAVAEVVPEPRRSEIYARQAARSQSFAAYQEKTARRIPVVALTLYRDPPA
ncbi:MAG: nitroreductase/quinone reductase family protein [Solirubrobacteraceae bacterium]